MTTINPADHLGLVWNIARSYASKCHEPVEDLVQEGYLGLARAAEKFDPSRGMKFSSYAAWWVSAAISHYMRETRTVHIPDHVSRRLRKAGEMPPQLSLNVTLAGPEGNTWLDLLEHDGPNPEDVAAAKEQRALLWAEVAKLPRRSKNILRMRYVLGQTLEQVGQTMGVTRQAIEQAEKKALRLLKPRLEKLGVAI